MTRTTLPSQNEAWGFYGTITHLEDPRASDHVQAWRLAFDAIRSATRVGDEGIRLFLDSRGGRHFADDVANELSASQSTTLKEAILAATERWMGWTISRRTSFESGIPAGMPYLTGFVANAEVEADLIA